MTEEQAAQEASKAMFMTQAQVLKAGKDPAQYMYNLAKRWGYAKAAEAKPGEDKDEVIANGQRAMSMGGGEAPASEHVEDVDDDEFAEAMNDLGWGDFVR
jgi:hypothetical protein